MAITTRFKFLQFSDILLDSKLTLSMPATAGHAPLNCGFALPRAERQERAREILETTINAFSLAASENVDAILMPGGLFDANTVSGYTINTLIESIATISHIPIFITPGLEDFYTRSSLYAADMLQARGLKSWPANVHIFSHEHFESVLVPGRGDVAISGRAITKGSRRSERILSGKVPKNNNAAINVAMLAATLETHPQVAHLAGTKAIVYPISQEEMEAQKMSYFALGHLPEAHKIEDLAGEGRTIGAYAGCLASGSFDKLGPRVALLGEIGVDSLGNTEVDLTPQEIDERRMMLVVVDVSGLGDGDIKEEIMVHIEDSGVRPDTDIVALSLEGGCKPGANPKRVADSLASSFYCMLVVDNTRPDYLAERFDERTTEWKYIQSMLQMKTRAERSGTKDPEGSELSDSLSGVPGRDLSGKTVEDALYYGLDALRQKRVTIRNVG